MKAVCLTVLIVLVGTFAFMFISGTKLNEMKNMKIMITDLQNQLAEKEEMITSLKQQMAEKELANNSLQNEMAELIAEVISIQTELDFTRSQLDKALISNAEYEAQKAELTTSLNTAQASLWEKDATYQECVSQTRIMEIQLENEHQSVSALQSELAEKNEEVNDEFSLMGLNNNILIILVIGIASLSMALPAYQYIRENKQPSRVWINTTSMEKQPTCWDDTSYREFRREKARELERRSRECK